MSDMLSIGASGVRSYQTALTTTSENIANAGNAGYSRRTTKVGEVVATGGMQAISVNGMGVVVNGVVRAGNAQRSADVRAANADLARSQAGVVWLERIETSLTSNKLDERMTAFFNAANALASDPTASAARATLLQAGASLAHSFSATANTLDNGFVDLDSNGDAAARELNNLTAGLARINASLSRTSIDSSGRAALLDERDRMLEGMSAVTDISTTFDTAGRASVRVGGGGPLLVQGDQAATATYARSEGAVTFALYGIDGGHAISANGGAMAGIVDGAARLNDTAQELDALAVAFAQGVNAVQAQGVDQDGNAGAPMFSATTANDFTLTLDNPRGIAARNPGAGERDNDNLEKLALLRREGGFESQITTMTAGNASALAGRRAIAEVQDSIRNNAVVARDSLSGVNVDEEAVDLIRFQQAFQASSRVIQVARETLQSIFDIR